MNSQANYIVHASLILSLCAGIFFFVNKFPVEVRSQCKTPVYYVTSDTAILSDSAEAGKLIFNMMCASCHTLFKDATGPNLVGFTERGPWSRRQNVYDWIHNVPAFMSRNNYARELKKKYGPVMTSFPDMSTEVIDAICAYLTEIDKKTGKPE